MAQAHGLIGKSPQTPSQADLRRAVSTAYYALFHQLTEDAARAMFGHNDTTGLHHLTRRAFDHRTMKRAAHAFSSTSPARPWDKLMAFAPGELKLVAAAFVDLQAARHRADYDLAEALTPAEVPDLLDHAATALATWQQLASQAGGSPTAEARVFMAALLVHGQIARG